MKDDSQQTPPKGERGAKLTLIFLLTVIVLGLLSLIAKGMGLI